MIWKAIWHVGTIEVLAGLSLVLVFAALGSLGFSVSSSVTILAYGAAAALVYRLRCHRF